MVGFDEVLDDVLDKLIGQQTDLQIISIIGMGGIGKTTLARNIYENPLVVHENSVHEILLELVYYLEKQGKENLSQLDEPKLGEKLHKRLSRWRYLIIMDDLWSNEKWDSIRSFFPNNNSGSRIMITTRISNLASQSHGFRMNFLDENKSWILLCKNVFGKESFPIELEEIGKKIARNCKGLPLSIVVVGGFLGKSERTREYWEYIAKNLNSIVNSEDDKLSLQILYMSYYQLPIHLKPCFLYMGVFPEDSEIRVSALIKLWVAEGFLKPIGGKSLEEAAELYLKELIDRNLVLDHKLGSSGKIKLCKVHDLLRDLCLREADKQKFLGHIMQHRLCAPQAKITQRRVGIHRGTSAEKYYTPVSSAQQYASLVRSLIWDYDVTQYELINLTWESEEDPLKRALRSDQYRLLRIFKLDMHPYAAQVKNNMHFEDGMFKLFNSRYLSYPNMGPAVPSSVYRFWNLHTLIARGTSATAPLEIGMMPLLKHVEFGNIYLPNPPNGNGHTRDDFVLGNLQTLFRVRIWDCREEVVKRIPNIKKLKVCQEKFERWSVSFLNNISYLHKLESLRCLFIDSRIRSELLQNLAFPQSLRKLALHGCYLHWEDITKKIGSLPLLEVLKLEWNSFVGHLWETVEGDFSSLKFLLIKDCHDLEFWRTDSTHFPRLEHLRLFHLNKLKKIPSDIGEIHTLQTIQLVHCRSSTAISAKKILEE